MFDSVRVARGVIRSLRIYYGDWRRRGALDRHYARFVTAGDLVFDIGSHVGDRVAAFRSLVQRLARARWRGDGVGKQPVRFSGKGQRHTATPSRG